MSMASVEALRFMNGLYLLGYAWVFGMSVWVSFFGGVIAHRTLTRQQFSTLQHKSFPVYFTISILVTSLLLGVWVFKNPRVISLWWQPNVADVAQAYALAIVVLAQGLNYFVIGPLTWQVIVRRYQLEKDEGKAYNDPNVSAQMKALNARFSTLHGISSLLNLFAIIALAFHGFQLGSVGC